MPLERKVMVPLVLLKGGDSPVFEQNRPTTLRRPCECGCDNRGNPDLVGYLHGIRDGVGFTMEIHDESVYQHMEKVFGNA